MKAKDFYRDAKIALERLNPRQLSSGGFVNDCVPCAIGAYLIADENKERIEPGELSSLAMNAYYNASEAYHSAPAELLVNKNEKFHEYDNSADRMTARWKHVYKWVCRKAA